MAPLRHRRRQVRARAWQAAGAEGLEVETRILGRQNDAEIGLEMGLSAPMSIAATLAQENAEILAGLVVTQVIEPGTPVTYGGIPHILDPRTGWPLQSVTQVSVVGPGAEAGEVWAKACLLNGPGWAVGRTPDTVTVLTGR